MLSVGVKPRASSCSFCIFGMILLCQFQSLYLLEIDTELFINEPSSLEFVSWLYSRGWKKMKWADKLE